MNQELDFIINGEVVRGKINTHKKTTCIYDILYSITESFLYCISCLKYSCTNKSIYVEYQEIL
jgi:hypothetical protein